MPAPYCIICERAIETPPLCAECAAVPALVRAFTEGQERLRERGERVPK